MEKKPYYYCKRLRLLEWLLNRGFTPVKKIPDPTNPKYNWWLFESTADLTAAVNEYIEQVKTRDKVS